MLCMIFLTFKPVNELPESVDFDQFCLVFPGPVMAKFTIALREISTYKERLRFQVMIYLMLLLTFLFFSSVLFCKG